MKYLAAYEGRSINGEVLYLARREIEAFEKGIRKDRVIENYGRISVKTPKIKTAQNWKGVSNSAPF